MNVLFLTSRYPYPPDRGDRLTILNLLRALSARHAVTLVAFTNGSEPPEAAEHVAPYCSRIETVHLPTFRSWIQAWGGVFTSMPSQVTYYLSRTMRERVRSLLASQRYDAIITHVIRMGPYAADVDHPLKIMFQADSNGAALGRSMRFAPWWKRLGIRWERHRVDQYMVHCAQRFRETWVLAPDDKKDLERLGCPRVEMVPHGVDERLFQLERRALGEPRLMFLGNLSVPHNIDAATYAVRELWPAIRQRWPGARLFLAGADPAPAVRQLGQVEGVEVTGRVPDLAVLWQSMHVLLAPLRFSTGIQNKILEAMAAGVPVVTVPAVAEAIHARDGVHLLTSDSASGLIEAVNRTLQDPDAASARAACAREHVRAHFTWDLPVRRMEALAAETEPATARGSVA